MRSERLQFSKRWSGKAGNIMGSLTAISVVAIINIVRTLFLAFPDTSSLVPQAQLPTRTLASDTTPSNLST